MTVRRCSALLALACPLMAAPVPASAGLTAEELATVAFTPPPGARLQPDLLLRDEAGAAVTPAQMLGGRSAVLVFADYDCAILCGTALGLTASALAETGLAPGRDFVLLGIGIDPRDGPEQAAARRRADLDGEDRAALATAARLLTGDAAALHAAAASVGYTAQYDAASDSFAHPLGVLVLAPDGRVVRVLSALAPDPTSLRLALVEAADGHGTGTLADRMRLLCYGFDAVQGIYTPAVGRLLAAGGVATVLGLAAGLLALRRREGRP